MAIKPILQFRNQDSTRDLNTTQARIVDRAIFDGGTLTPSAVSLQVSIAPFVAAGFDGIVAVSDATENKSIPAPTVAGPARVSYLILHLEYRSLTTPIYNLQVIPETTWLTSVSKDYFITFAKFSVPFGSTSLTDPSVSIDYSVGDWADKLGKTGWRQPVATAAALPTTQNRDGDVRIAFDTRLAYAWNASTQVWSPIGGAVDLAEVASRSAESRHQYHRVTSGSGFLNEIPQDTLGPGASVAGNALRTYDIPVNFPYIPGPGAANTGYVSGCHYLMNGHFIKTRSAKLTFAAAPGIGERFDLLILEAWRVPVTIPSTETYLDEGGSPSTFAALRTALEQMEEQSGSLAASWDLSEMEVYDSTTFVVTRYQYRIISSVNISVLTSSSSVAGSIVNVDGNAFSVGTNTDQKLWQAVSATSHDGVSWALPLVVFRRTSAELAGPPFIDTFRSDDQRYIFDVAPRAELGAGLFELTEVAKNSAIFSGIVQRQKAAAGFITGTSDPIGIVDGSLEIPASLIEVMGRNLYWPSAQSVALPSPPATGGRTDVVVVEVFKSIYPTPDRMAYAPMELTARDRIGPKGVQWYGRIRTFSLPLNVLQTTVEGALTATGVYAPAFDEPALWARVPDPTVGEDPNGEVYALPICLVHRRNTGAYALTLTGQNGSDRSAFPGLPNQPATFPYPGEVLDVRSRSVSDPEELQHLLDESFDKLLAGELRTNMVLHPTASSVAGTQLLQVDQIASSAPAGINLIPNSPNEVQTVWAESDEAELLTWTFFNMDLPQVDPSGVFSWNSGTNTLGIALPQGYMLSIDGQTPERPYGPQGFVAYSTDANVAGDRRPVPMTHTYFTGVPVPGWLISGDAVTPQPFRQTQVVLNLDGSVGYSEVDAQVYVAVWVVKKNHEAGRLSALNSYQQNRGLLAVPDQVHRIEYSLTGAAPFSRAWVGVPLNVIDVQVTGDVIVIDRATLFAQGSISSSLASSAGNLNTYAVAGITLSSTTAVDKLRYIQFSDDAGTSTGFERTRIEFQPGTVPGGTTARVTLVCTGDLVSTWFEVDPGSKQVRGPYSISQNLFSVTASTGHFTFPVSGRMTGWGDCGISVYGALIPGAQRSSAAFSPLSMSSIGYDISFYAAGSAGAAWECWFNPADRDSTRNISIGQTVGLQRAVDLSGAAPLMNVGAYSAFYSLLYEYTAGAFGNHTSLMLSPVRTPLPAGAVARIFYTYTPYQGITVDLEDKINGTVEGISDQVVFTSGPNRPWIDYRALSTGIRRGSQSASPPGVYSGSGGVGSDLGLVYSTGRVIDRNSALKTGDGSTYGGSFVSENQALPFRPADRPLLAVSQRLPFPTKAIDGAAVGTRYSPESFLSNSALLDAPVVRPVPPGSGYPRSEVSPWALEYSGFSLDERMWRAQASAKILYFPLPLNLGEALVGLTIETESGGPTGVVIGTFVSRDRTTGVVTPVSNERFYASVVGPANTRRLHEVSLPPIGLLVSNPRTEILLALTSSTSNLRVGQITISVAPNTIFASSDLTLKRIPYSDGGIGVGKTLRKGMSIEVPSSWTTEFASYEASLIQNGRQDYPGISPSRGLSTVYSLLGITQYGSGGLVGYVPGGDPVLVPLGLDGGISAPGFAGRETAPRINSRARPVLTGATAPDVSAGTALAYAVHNSVDEIHMGVSTGYSNVVNGTTTVRVGQAVDAFYPVGRPVFRRT